jgi:hypothetical protein
MPRIEKRLHRQKSPSFRWRLALSLLIIAATLTAAGVVGTHLYFSSNSQPHTLMPTSTAPIVQAPGKIISAENALPGTTAWLIPGASYSIQIQAYASATSVNPGQELTFYVSTQHSGTPYTVQIYRLGWYGGAGGRLLLERQKIGQAQGYYDPATHMLVSCHSCIYYSTTHLIEANWQPSFSITIPNNWVTGLYEAKLTDAHGNHAIVSFEVRGNPNAAYLVVIADNTTVAYNSWGGYSLYIGPNGSSQTRATKVSFDRPILSWYYGRGNGLPYEIDAIRWMERQGYDISYMSSVDLDENPGQLLNHRAFISLGHDEYWSKSMRDGVEYARDHGVGLAFLSANDVYWQIRYEPDSHGIPDRTIVCYKSAEKDPLYGTDNALVTVQWRDPPVNRPENALIGIMYVGLTNKPGAYPWRVNPTSSSPLLKGTRLQPGHNYGCNLVGSEWDSVANNGATPPGLTILGTSSVISSNHQREISDTTYYIAPSGAFVFASGSVDWTYALDNLRVWDFLDPAHVLRTDACLSHSRAIPGIQVLMEHVMSELITHHYSPAAINIPFLEPQARLF